MRSVDALKSWLGFSSKRDVASEPSCVEEAGDEVAFDPFPEPVRIEIQDVFDLHTINPRDVNRVVEEYLREAHAANFPFVRIIHGKGVGVQREIVRSILARTPFVINYADAPPEAGGWGATIARLAPDI